jgi:prepilin signal peptidase PulO-like enzyme (type II secretory pathway)
MLLFNLFIFIFGLIVGSFLNCVIYRLEIGKSFLEGHSFCPYCKHELIWHDLIPVFSFLMLKGKCRYCQKPISIQYPLVELTTALLFLLIINHYYLPFTIYHLLITCFLIVIFVYDLKHYIIPDKVIFPAIATAFIYNLFNIKYLILNTFPAALGASGFFLAIYLASKGKWMGFGDVKLSFLMGLHLGFPNILVALFLAFFTGAIIGLILIAQSKKTLKSMVPFGPFLVFGTFLAMFYGEPIINWYSNLFLI